MQTAINIRIDTIEDDISSHHFVQLSEVRGAQHYG